MKTIRSYLSSFFDRLKSLPAWLWQKKKYFFYWAVALSLVGWSWCFLYVHSYGNVWGGKDDAGRLAIKEKKEMLTKLAQMETGAASPADIYDQRVALSLQSGENKDREGARKMLQAENDALLKLPDSEENFGRRVHLEDLVAHTYMNEGLYGEARTSLNRAAALVQQMQDKYFSDDARLLSLGLTNELGVLTYLEASGTLDGKIRAETYIRCQTIFEKLLAQIDGLQADQAKLTEDTKKRLAGMKRHVYANLKQVKIDRAHEDEYQKT